MGIGPPPSKNPSHPTTMNPGPAVTVGIVGAGGIGGTLFAAFQRFEYDFVLAILITIIAVVLLGELASNYVKRIFRV